MLESSKRIRGYWIVRRIDIFLNDKIQVVVKYYHLYFNTSYKQNIYVVKYTR